ncbi:MAG: ABC transporter permease [Spirochaetia bacterium]
MQFTLALRNVYRQRKRTFLLAGLIAFGILVLTVINALSASFVENVEDNFANLLAGHIFIDGVEKSADGRNEISVIRDDDEILAAFDDAGIEVTGVSRRSEFTGAVIFQGDSVRQQFVGVNWDNEGFLTTRLSLVEGSFENMQNQDPDGFKRGIILSSDIADRLNLELQDRVVVRLETVTGQQNVGDFTVAGFSYDAGLFGSISAYADLEYVTHLIGLEPGEYQTMGVFLQDLDMAPEATDQYYQALSQRVNVFPRGEEDEGENPVEALFDAAEDEEWEGVRYRVYNVIELVSDVQQVTGAINIIGYSAFFVLFFIVTVGIVNTFRMIMAERIKEIGTMRALGMQRDKLLQLFLTEAFILGAGGIAAGMIISFLVMFGVNAIDFGVDNVFSLFMKQGHVTFRLIPLQVITNFFVVSILTVAAAFFPAKKAAYMPPVDALRSE